MKPIFFRSGIIVDKELGSYISRVNNKDSSSGSSNIGFSSDNPIVDGTSRRERVRGFWRTDAIDEERVLRFKDHNAIDGMMMIEIPIEEMNRIMNGGRE